LTVLEWFGEFFATLPEALHALWLFGDPEGRGRGWFGVFVLVLWAIPLTALPLYIAKITYGKREWVSATMGVMGATSILWWVFGIIPSAWMFFTSGEVDILEHAIIPSSATIEVREGYVIEIATDLYNVIVDSVTAADDDRRHRARLLGGAAGPEEPAQAARPRTRSSRRPAATADTGTMDVSCR
jgi:hypothetical protein